MGVVGQAEPLLGGLNLGEENIDAARLDGPQSGLLSRADRAGKLPGEPAQFQRNVENRAHREGRIQFVSRRHGKAPEKSVGYNWSLTAATHVSNSLQAPFRVSDP